jgi:uncharacterized protein YbbC (DUF1343 family)
LPGLGLGKADTHHESVNIATDEKTFEDQTKPFCLALQAGVPMVMSTHAIVPQFGPMPATLSPQAVAFVKKYNKRAILVTDDLFMKAVQAGRTIDEVVEQALEAGYHLLIFTAKPDEQVALVKRFDEQEVSAQQGAVCAEIERFKKQWLAEKNGGYAAVDDKAVSDMLVQRAVHVQGAYHALTDKAITLLTVNMPVVRTALTNERWFISNGKSYLARTLGKRGIEVEERILNPRDEASIDEVTAAAAATPRDDAHGVVVVTFFYANENWNTIQRQWLEQLRGLGSALTVISLGHPLERSIVPDAMIIECGSFQRALLERAVQLLCSPEPLAGADRLMQALTEKPFVVSDRRSLAKTVVSNHEPLRSCLSGKRIGLLCHRSSVVWRDGDAFFLPDELAAWARDQHDATKLAAIFSPEHGLEGTHEAAVSVNSAQGSRWGCPVYSLHGLVRKPTPEMLKGLDVIVIDLQDVGLRCFTYISTQALMLEAAAEHNISVVVLDRPNPLAMWGAQGPMLTDDNMSFVGKVRVPLLHGQTIGGLAKKLAADCGADVRVIAAQPSATNYFQVHPFLPPSPNIMSYEHLLAYPLTVLIEGTNYSEGRGTQHPFLQIGAPWVNAETLAVALNKQRFAGVYFEPVRFTPRSIAGLAQHPKHENTLCGGVFVHVYDPVAVQPMRVARALVTTLFKLYPKQSTFIRWGKPYGIDLLVGTKSWREIIQKKGEVA